MIKRKCLIIYNEPAADALPDELDVLDQVDFIAGILQDAGFSVSRKGITADFFKEISGILGKDYEFVFNLVEAVGQKSEILYFVPALLNMQHIPYTGCSVEAAFLSGSKVLARQIMKDRNIPVAGGYRITEAINLVPGKKYIVKPVWEDGSLGITEESVFAFDGTVPDVLKDKSEGHWFIEEYIDGREFNISILSSPRGPEVLPPAEIVFHDYPDDVPRIVSYKAKWIEESFQYANSKRSFPENLSNRLMHNIKETSLACWHSFGLRGYARVDMRVDNNENVYVLEVNANPCIAPDSGFIAAALHAGYTLKEVVNRIISDLNI
jgi:D-alanine-D-alanine ligase